MEEKPKTWLRILKWVTVGVLAVVLYVLSIGPAAYVGTLAGEDSRFTAAILIVYKPVLRTIDGAESLGGRYIIWWSSLAGATPPPAYKKPR
jgi:hypothetical protein